MTTTVRLQDIAARKLAAWNETDPGRRHALVAALWTADAAYRDPLVEARGHDAIAALIGGVQTSALRAARPWCRAWTTRCWPGTAGSRP